MYEASRVGEGLIRMLELTAEGATWVVLIAGTFGIGVLVRQRRGAAVPLLVVAGLIFVQFVLIGAGKPAEYGRFGVFIDVTLAIAAACALTHPWPRLKGPAQVVAAVAMGLWVCLCGFQYLANFVADASPDNSRILAARSLGRGNTPVALLAEPAPYSCPPLNFSKRPVWLVESAEAWRRRCEAAPRPEANLQPRLLVATSDVPTSPHAQEALYYRWQLLTHGSCMPSELPQLTPVSWANKLFRYQAAPRIEPRPTSQP
jgi:hypothetical protein